MKKAIAVATAMRSTMVSTPVGRYSPAVPAVFCAFSAPPHYRLKCMVALLARQYLLTDISDRSAQLTASLM